MKDVALRAGVTPGTASRAIRGRGYVSADVRRRVADAVRTLAFRPSWTAQALRAGRSHLVGLVIPDILNVHYTSLSRAVARLLRGSGYDMILCVNDDDPSVDRSYLEVLRDKRVDGVIYVPPETGSNADLVSEIVAAGAAVVELNRQREAGRLDAVIADNAGGARLMTERLLAAGHRRIGIIVGSDPTTGAPRAAGYRRALADAGVRADAALVRMGAFNREYGETATRALLDLRSPPTAIFAGSNRILMGALHVINQRGLRVGKDISVASFNDTEWLSIWSPPITAVDVDAEHMAREAVARVLGRLDGSAGKPVTVTVPVRLIERASVAALA